ncbi:MAG: protease Do family protein [Micavibrio sp.]|nr:protease Do family protein [Micavibrio sp.]
MKNILRTSAAVIALTLSATALPQPAHAVSYGPPSLAPLVDQLLPAVVNISSTVKMGALEGQDDESAPGDMGGQNGPQKMPDMPHFPPGSPFEDFFNEFMNKHGGDAQVSPATSLGSGFIIDADKGYIVTNAHVVQDAEKVRVTLHDDTTLPAEIIGKDEKVDLALLKVDVSKHKLTAVHFGDSAPLRVGDWVMAIGNPFGLGGTVTAGIISAQARDIQAGQYDDFIQTDASINKGNSGGPMFDMSGNVIGINTAIYSPSGGSVGIGFAVPSNLAKPVIDQLIKYGHTRRGWMGVRIQTVTEDIAESLGLPMHNGALVASITPGGPAEKAGLKAGDVILNFDGKDVTQMRSLPRIVAETEIGKAAPIVYWRDSKKMNGTVTIGELEKAEKDGLLKDAATEQDAGPQQVQGTPIPSVGLSLRGVTETDRSAYNIPGEVQGVVVSAVAPGKDASDKGMQIGDVIVEINQQPAKDAKTAIGIIDAAAKAGKASILLLVNREGDVRFVALRLNPVEQTKGKAK